MEEMSKKTKRLEKENLTLSRKHEATNQNILKMAEDRTRTHKELELLRKKNENLEKLCRGMQAQGRGQVPPLPPLEDEGTESEYEEDSYHEDSDSDSNEEYMDDDDDDTEDERLHEVHAPATAARRPFGPVPPPAQSMTNGSANVNGRKGSQHLTGQQLNGIRA
jgi:hypothetical protein